MAVEAQYPSTFLLLNRKVQEGKNIHIVGNKDYSLPAQPGGGGFLDESSYLNFDTNGFGNPRKRRRELATTNGVYMNSLGFSNQNQNQNRQLLFEPNVVSTGLGLSFGDQNLQPLQPQQQPQPSLLSLLSQDLSIQFKQQTDELNYFLQSQKEQLRRTLEEKRQRHYYKLLGAAEEVVARKMREKDEEIEKAARRNAELEAQWAQLRTEAHSWQAKAQAQEAQAAALQAQIQQANAGPLHQGREGSGDGYADDSESVYVDPLSERRVDPLSCKVCRKRVASVVLLPCRHLCVCTECNGVVSACPLCLSLRSGSVEVFLT